MGLCSARLSAICFENLEKICTDRDWETCAIIGCSIRGNNAVLITIHKGVNTFESMDQSRGPLTLQ
jgi:hypothetical protein